MNLLKRFWHWIMDPLPDREFPMPFERKRDDNVIALREEDRDD